MRFLLYIFVIFSIVLVYSSCSDKQYQILFEKQTALADSTAKKTPVTLDTYQIQPQDILQIRNLQNLNYIVDQSSTVVSSSSGSTTTSSQGQTYQVEEDSTVALPVIGHVRVVGLTRSEAQRKVEKLYKDSLLRNPIIELKIVNLKVTVIGEVKQPGAFPLIKDKTTLVEMIGEAGGLTDKGNGSTVKIIRGNASNPKVTVANLNDVNSVNDPNNVLQNGDIIYVSESRRAARADNLQNFSTVFSPVLLIINTALIILTLARK